MNIISFDDKYKKHGEVWMDQPSKTAYNCAKFFKEQGIKSVILPAFGYGRNVDAFKNFDLSATEVSNTGIKLAKEKYNIKIFKHNIFDKHQFTYEGVYSFSLLHLFEKKSDRQKIFDNLVTMTKINGFLCLVSVTNNNNYTDINTTKFGHSESELQDYCGSNVELIKTGTIVDELRYQDGNFNNLEVSFIIIKRLI